MKTALLFMVLSPVSACLILAVSASEGEKADWKTLVTSEKESEREAGRKSVLEERSRYIDDLLEIVRSDVAQGEQFYLSNTTRNIAIYLLGKFRAEEAVPDLISWLAPREGQVEKISEEVYLPPAGMALVEIGLPAVGPLRKKIEQEGVESRLGMECLKTMYKIKGAAETQRLLKKAVQQEKDTTKRKRLEVALEMLPKLPGVSPEEFDDAEDKPEPSAPSEPSEKPEE